MLLLPSGSNRSAESRRAARRSPPRTLRELGLRPWGAAAFTCRCRFWWRRIWREHQRHQRSATAELYRDGDGNFGSNPAFHQRHGYGPVSGRPMRPRLLAQSHKCFPGVGGRWESSSNSRIWCLTEFHCGKPTRRTRSLNRGSDRNESHSGSQFR